MGLPPLLKVSSNWEIICTRGCQALSGLTADGGHHYVILLDTHSHALFHQFLQRVLIGGASYTFSRDHCGHILGRRYVESGVLDSNSVRSHLLAAEMRHFCWVALLNGNFTAIGSRQIDGRKWGGYIEGDGIFFRHDGYGVSPDLVSYVSIGGDAVGAYYDGCDFAFLHHDSGHAVGDYGGGDA